MDLSWKTNLIVTAIITVIADVLLIIKCGWEGIIPGFIVITIFVPLAALGIHFWVNHTGERFINGPDWKSMSPEQVKYAIHIIGLTIVISSVVWSVAILFIIMSKYGHIVFGVLLVAGIVIMLAGLSRVFNAKKIGNRRVSEKSGLSKWLIYAVTMIVIIVPSVVLTMENGDSNVISVEFGDDSIHVEGPMFDHNFAYSEIEQLTLDPDFDRGSRIYGYSTGSIQSGKFDNDALGRYYLASYTSCDSCVVIKVGSDYYAFNQKTEALTQSLYDELVLRTAP